MNANNKYKHYSAADIQKYLRGDLSAREMQALEAAALDDPFLADALEGIESDRLLRDEASFQEDLATLKDRLARRLEKTDKIFVMPLYRSVWKVAAAVILLTGLGSITYRYLLNGRHSTPVLARSPAEKKIAPADSFITDRMKSAPQHEDQVKEEANNTKEAGETKKPAHKAIAAGAVAAETLEGATPPSAPVDHLTPSAALFRDTLASGVETASAFNNSSSRGGQFLVGKVTDHNNNPIPLITISISGHQQAIKTDTTGLFRIQMLGSDSATHIRIGSTGFESVEVPAYVLADKSANGGLANTIRLQTQLDGSGYTAMNNFKMKKISSDNGTNVTTGFNGRQSGIVQQAVPESGWPAYKTYLEKNKMTGSIDSTRKGTEAISFKVSKKGHLSSFKVESSVSPTHDSLLLHLIRHGSAWKPLSGNNSSAMVILSY